MELAFVILGWVFSAIFLFISILIFGMGGKLQSVLVLFIVLLIFSPLNKLINNLWGISIPWWGRGLLIIGLLGGMMVSFILNPAKSIYKTPEYKSSLMKIYDAKLKAWPVPYEIKYIDSKYGKIHVIISGPTDAPPILLINASGLAAWSWIHNIEALSKNYRTYAVDNIGEGGKNQMIAPNNIPKNEIEIADYYTELTDKFGISESYVVGASIGGYIATCYALHAPQRVKKLVLLGSMGYGFTPLTVLAMMIAQGFPIKPIQEATFRWAFGKADQVQESFGEWFRIYMKGLKIKVPVLAYFGTEEVVIGDAQKAKNLLMNIPNAEVRIVKTGHVIGAEIPDIVNPEIVSFFSND